MWYIFLRRDLNSEIIKGKIDVFGYENYAYITKNFINNLVVKRTDSGARFPGFSS